MSIIGLFLSLTIVGSIIGIPLLIIGIILISQNNKSKDNKSSKSAKKKITTDKPVQKQKSNFEEDIAVKWSARIGILALVVGVAFFIKYAIDMNWISYNVRLLLGLLLGIGLIVTGRKIPFESKYSKWGQTLVGGGIAITYFITYASFSLQNYQLSTGIDPVSGIFLLFAVAIAAIIISVKDNSKIIATESFALGYLTAILSMGLGTYTLIYTLILTIALISVVILKKWQIIGLGGLLATYILYLNWFSYSNETLSFTFASLPLAFIFALFAFKSYKLMDKDESTYVNAISMALNSIIFYFLFYSNLLFFDYDALSYVFAFGYALSFIIFYAITKEYFSKIYSTILLYLGNLFIVLSVALEVNVEYITIIYALLTLLFTSLHLTNKELPFKYISFILGALTAAKTIFYDITNLTILNLNNFLSSTRALSFIITIICAFTIYKLWINNKTLLESHETHIPKLYFWAASFFTILIFFIELFEKYDVLFSIALIASIIASLIFYSSKYEELKYQIVIYSAILFFKTLIIDSVELTKFSSEHIAIGARLMTFIFVIIMFYFIGAYLNNKNNFDNAVKTLSSTYTLAATILAFTLLLIELSGFWISIGWTALALLMITAGFHFENKQFRLQGIIILMITTAKVFLYDPRNLETIYRTFSYMILGVILLGISFVYTKYKDKLKDLLN